MKSTRNPKKLDGEFHVKITDGGFNKTFEDSVGLNDKKGLQRLVSRLKHKGVNLKYEDTPEDDWW